MENEKVREKIMTNVLDAYLFLDAIQVKHKLSGDKNIEELLNIFGRIKQYAEEI